ncbi:hypothetical protein NKJ74_31390 [Mesorhizobium sp. M0046]|uniref:hypothetical protein n=1 Tax=Mesorhizobium sp. M0046 TaxID=2956858 RepID=UPI00333BBD6A
MRQYYVTTIASGFWLLMMTIGVLADHLNQTESERKQFLELQAFDISRPERCGENPFCFMLEMAAIEASVSDEFTDEQVRSCWAAIRTDTPDQARRVVKCARASK